jgi:hypothetical protein
LSGMRGFPRLLIVVLAAGVLLVSCRGVFTEITPDTTAPGEVASPEVSNITSAGFTLKWTNPGDRDLASLEISLTRDGGGGGCPS